MAAALVRPPLCVIVVCVVGSNGRRLKSNHEVWKESLRVEAVRVSKLALPVGRSPVPASLARARI